MTLSTSVLGAEECKARSKDSLNVAPPFWCDIKATIMIGGNCTTQVEEQIHLPWSSGAILRYVPKPELQTLQDVRAHIRSEDTETEVYVAPLPDSAPTNTIFNIRVSATTEPVTVVLRYSVFPGVVLFKNCEGVMDFPVVTPPSGYSVMVSKWAMGGLSVAEIASMQVEFQLLKVAHTSYIDSRVKQPSPLSMSTRDTTESSGESVDTSITYSGKTTGFNPGEFIFYFRFRLTNGWAECPNVRSCRAETLQLKEEFEPGIGSELVIGLAVGGGVALVVMGIAVWVTWCIMSGRRNEEEVEANLPDSLRHFAYDTGDDESSRKWRSWMEGGPSSEKEEICAIDLSPRNRSK